MDTDALDFLQMSGDPSIDPQKAVEMRQMRQQEDEDMHEAAKAEI